MLHEVESLLWTRSAVREHQRIAYGHVHVGCSELRLDSPVVELHHRVYDRLRVYEHRYAVGIDAEEPMGLDHLESLVYECSGVDRDLCAHAPLGVLEGPFRRDVGQLLGRYVTQGAAAACYYESPHGGVFARKALEYGRVF